MNGRSAATLLALLAALSAPSCVRKGQEAPRGVLVVSQEQQSSWVRNFNPLTTATAARWPTLAGVYEPLFVFNSVRAEYVPWLAVASEWREGNTALRVTTREGVLWSDGRPVSARDAAATLEAAGSLAAARMAPWLIASARAIDERRLLVRSATRDCRALTDLAVGVVPEAVALRLADPGNGEGDFDPSVVTAGRYMLGSWELDRGLTLEAVAADGGVRPATGIVFRVNRDDLARLRDEVQKRSSLTIELER